MDKNAKKNAKPNTNPIPGNKRIGHELPQPTPEQKKAGWKKKRKLWYWIEKYSQLSLRKFENIKQEIKTHPENYDMYQFQAIQYITKGGNGDPRFLFDSLDRTEGKARQSLEMSGKDGGDITIKIKDYGSDDRTTTETKGSITRSI